MNSVIKACVLTVCLIVIAGCSGQKGDVVTDADQSAIEAYKATEAAEQAALDGEMENTSAP